MKRFHVHVTAVSDLEQSIQATLFDTQPSVKKEHRGIRGFLYDSAQLTNVNVVAPIDVPDEGIARDQLAKIVSQYVTTGGTSPTYLLAASTASTGGPTYNQLSD